MSDDSRRHAPTKRHLERLRAAGVAPTSDAVHGIILLASATLVGLLWGPKLGGFLSVLLAVGLKELPAESSLTSLLASRLVLAGGLVTLIAVGVGITAGVVNAWQSRLLLRPLRPRPRRLLAPVDLAEASLAMVGIVGGFATIVMTLQTIGQAADWSALTSSVVFVATWLRHLCLLAGLAIVHLLWTRARHQRRSMMTDRELRDEQRETQGSWLREQLKRRKR